MKTLFLAFAIWPLALIGATAGLVLDTSAQTGEIVLEQASFCDFVVVKTPRGFSFLEIDHGVILIASGNHISGNLSTNGTQSISIDGRATTTARVTAYDQNWERAKKRFELLCPSDNPTEEITIGGG